MILDTLTLRGAKGIKDRLGLDEITIDFKGRTGLIGLAGDNGMGKTTVMECLQPWPTFFSREDNDLKSNFFLKDSLKDLSYWINGNHYRSLIKINAQSTRAPEGFLWLDGESMVNGKISAYKDFLSKKYPSVELMRNSVLSTQREPRITELRTGELQAIFAEFLNLAWYEQKEEAAKQCGNILAGKLASIDRRIEALKAQVGARESCEREFNKLGAALEGLAEERLVYDSELKDLEAQAEKLKEIISANAATMARGADLRESIERMSKELGFEKTAYEKNSSALKDKYQGLRRELDKAEALLAYREKILGAVEEEKRVSGFLEKAVKERDEMVPEVEKIRERLHEIEMDIPGLKQALTEIENNKEIREIETQIRDLTHLITQAEEKIKDLDLKDPHCQSTTCRFIAGALDARLKLPFLKGDLKLKEADRDILKINSGKEKDRINKEIESKTKDIKADKDLLLEKTGSLQILKNRVVELDSQIAELKKLSGQAPEIRIAEARKEDLKKAMAEIALQGTAAKEAWGKREAAVIEQILAEKEKLEQIEAEIDQEAEGKLSAVKSDIDSLVKAAMKIESQITEKREALARVKGELFRIDEAEKELETSQAEKDRLIGEISEWKRLQVFCGKTGYQAIELSAAAPIITQYANELLTTAFGPLCTISFEPQDSEGREKPQILVFNEAGEEVKLGNRSGGQQVWALKALKLAMTLLSKERSGWNLETFFADEEDGALTVENAKKFVQLYRACLDIGNFKTGIFISHKPETLNYADHILSFEAGRVPEWN